MSETFLRRQASMQRIRNTLAKMAPGNIKRKNLQNRYYKLAGINTPKNLNIPSTLKVLDGIKREMKFANRAMLERRLKYVKSHSTFLRNNMNRTRTNKTPITIGQLKTMATYLNLEQKLSRKRTS
jgi:L-asparaginase II